MNKLILPFPISVNAMYSNLGRRRVKSKRYRIWREKAVATLQIQYNQKLIDYNIKLEIALSPKDKRKRDLDNHAKAIQDTLTSIVITDDSLIKELYMYWLPKSKNGYANIIIKKYK